MPQEPEFGGWQIPIEPATAQQRLAYTPGALPEASRYR